MSDIGGQAPAQDQQAPQPAWAGDVTARRGPSGPRSGFWRRFGALLIDSLILGVAYGVLLALFNAGVAYALYLVADFAYYTLLEGGPTGQTVGKRALGIRVIDFRAGGPIGYGRGFLRQIGKILSGIPFGLGYFWMLWDREKQCWQDKIATTVVVPVDAYPVR